MDDPQRFVDLYRAWWVVARDSALRILDCEQDADDAAQRVFMRIWNTGASERVRYPRRYFTQAGRREALTILRERLRGHALFPREGFMESWMCPDVEPDIAMVSVERREEVARLLQSLPPRCRLVCEMVWVHGLSQDEVASRLKISKKAVEKQVARGRARARHMVSPKARVS